MARYADRLYDDSIPKYFFPESNSKTNSVTQNKVKKRTKTKNKTKQEQKQNKQTNKQTKTKQNKIPNKQTKKIKYDSLILFCFHSVFVYECLLHATNIAFGV